MNVKNLGHFNLNEDQTAITFTMTVTIPIIKEGDALTPAQYEALKSYCQRFVLSYANLYSINTPIAISAGEIHRRRQATDEIKNRMFFDAETGELYDEGDIYEQIRDGKHEIRIRATEDPEAQNQPEK